MIRRFPVRWQIAVLLCLITTVNYVDRQAFTVAGPVIAEEFSLSNTQFGLIVSGFLFAYALGQLLVGPIVDRLGTKRAFGIAVVAWSIAGMLCAAGRGFLSFFTLRALLGITEAANFPAALKSVAEWFPRSERSLAVGIITIGPGLGAIISPPLLGYLIIAWGWQWAFIVPGAAGFVWLWVWQRFYHSPANHPGLSAEERELILTGRDEEESGQVSPAWNDFLRFLRYREVWGLMLSRFFHDGAFYFYVNWIALFLYQVHGFDIKQIAIFAWIPFLAADIGSVAGGWMGKWLIQRGMSLDRSRRIMIWGTTLLIPLTLPAFAVDSAFASIAMIALAMFVIQAKAVNLFALPADMFPAREVATIWGLFGAVGSAGGMVFAAFVGWITDISGYGAVFAAVGVTQLLSALVITCFVPRIGLLGQPGGAG